MLKVNLGLAAVTILIRKLFDRLFTTPEAAAKFAVSPVASGVVILAVGVYLCYNHLTKKRLRPLSIYENQLVSQFCDKFNSGRIKKRRPFLDFRKQHNPFGRSSRSRSIDDTLLKESIEALTVDSCSTCSLVTHTQPICNICHRTHSFNKPTNSSTKTPKKSIYSHHKPDIIPKCGPYKKCKAHGDWTPEPSAGRKQAPPPRKTVVVVKPTLRTSTTRSGRTFRNF